MATKDSPTAQNILRNNDIQKYNVAFSVYDINLKINSFFLIIFKYLKKLLTYPNSTFARPATNVAKIKTILTPN